MEQKHFVFLEAYELLEVGRGRLFSVELEVSPMDSYIECCPLNLKCFPRAHRIKHLFYRCWVMFEKL